MQNGRGVQLTFSRRAAQVARPLRAARWTLSGVTLRDILGTVATALLRHRAHRFDAAAVIHVRAIERRNHARDVCGRAAPVVTRETSALLRREEQVGEDRNWLLAERAVEKSG